MELLNYMYISSLSSGEGEFLELVKNKWWSQYKCLIKIPGKANHIYDRIYWRGNVLRMSPELKIILCYNKKMIFRFYQKREPKGGKKRLFPPNLPCQVLSCTQLRCFKILWWSFPSILSIIKNELLERSIRSLNVIASVSYHISWCRTLGDSNSVM